MCKSSRICCRGRTAASGFKDELDLKYELIHELRRQLTVALGGKLARSSVFPTAPLSTPGADATTKRRCRIQPCSGDSRYSESSAERRDNHVVLFRIRTIRVDAINKPGTTLVFNLFADLEFSQSFNMNNSAIPMRDTADKYHPVVDPFQTLPDGLEDPNLLSFALSRLIQSDDFTNDHHQRFIGRTLLGAISRAKAAAAVAIAALTDPAGRSAKK
jgi:hypothetical protein